MLLQLTYEEGVLVLSTPPPPFFLQLRKLRLEETLSLKPMVL